MKLLPILVCRKGEIGIDDFQRRIKELNRNILSEVQVLKEKIINDESDIVNFEKYTVEADFILLYKLHLGLGNCVIKISEFNCPLILFNKIGGV